MQSLDQICAQFGTFLRTYRHIYIRVQNMIKCQPLLPSYIIQAQCLPCSDINSKILHKGEHPTSMGVFTYIYFKELLSRGYIICISNRPTDRHISVDSIGRSQCPEVFPLWTIRLKSPSSQQIPKRKLGERGTDKLGVNTQTDTGQSEQQTEPA